MRDRDTIGTCAPVVDTSLNNPPNPFRKLSILVTTIGIYPEKVGGAEIHVYYVCSRLSERGHSMLVVTSALPSSLTRASDPRAPFAKYPLKLWPTPLSALSYVIKSVALSLILRKQVDIVHAHVADYPMVAAFFSSLLSRKPFTITCHGSDVRVYGRKFSRRILQAPFLRKAKSVFAVSNEIAGILTQKYGVHRDKIHVIKNGYDERATKKLVSIQPYGSIKNSKMVVCVASMRPEKDHMTLLKGFAKLTKKVSGAQLSLIGDGPLRPRLEEFCAQQGVCSVKFLGNLSHRNLLECVSRSDVFALTSSEEGMPTAVVEALALGKPVVATRVGGIPEVVKDGENGILIPPKSPEHLANALERLLTDSELRIKLGKVAAESVKDYAWNKIAEKYEDIYRKVFRLKR
jgi:glycosyltransferase involved in cell wall biosynthesis